MAIRPIIIAPDRRLKACSEPVAVAVAIRALFDDMLETMYDSAGTGLAAIQIGVRKCCIVADVQPLEHRRAPAPTNTAQRRAAHGARQGRGGDGRCFARRPGRSRDRY